MVLHWRSHWICFAMWPQLYTVIEEFRDVHHLLAFAASSEPSTTSWNRGASRTEEVQHAASVHMQHNGSMSACRPDQILEAPQSQAQKAKDLPSVLAQLAWSSCHCPSMLSRVKGSTF